MADFDRLLPPLATLVAFEAAYRHRNFSHAATELFQSPTTVSRRIRELEDDLGLCLFERHRHDVTPTADADELAASVRLSLSELSSTADRLRRRASDGESLTILASLSLTSVMVAPILDQFQQRHPDLSIRVVSACEPIETTHEAFDVALQYGERESERFEVEFITHEAVYPVCSPAFAARLPATVTAERLAGLPLLHVDYDDPTWATWATFLAELGVDRSKIERARVFTSYAACLDIAERGEGVALGWEHSVTHRLSAGTLVRIPDLAMPSAGRIHAYTSDSGPSRQHANEFVDLIRRNLAAHHSPTTAPQDTALSIRNGHRDGPHRF